MWVDQRKYKILGQVLAAARKRAMLTQVQLAQALKKPQSFVSGYERGQRRLDVLEFLQITKTIKVDPQRLFREVVIAFQPPRGK